MQATSRKQAKGCGIESLFYHIGRGRSGGGVGVREEKLKTLFAKQALAEYSRDHTIQTSRFYTTMEKKVLIVLEKQ
jgi:hypothetical protein